MEKPVKKKLQIENKFDKIAEKTLQEKYSNQYYPEGSIVEVPGSDFADFINVMGNNQQMLKSIKEALVQMAQAVDARMASNDVMTLTLMQQHTKNVDKGITLTQVSEEQLAAQTAEETTTEAAGEKPVRKPRKAVNK